LFKANIKWCRWLFYLIFDSLQSCLRPTLSGVRWLHYWVFIESSFN